jgi:hypothetical protein
MKKPYNVPLRVKHFNNQIKQKEGKIKFSKSLGSDKNNPMNYTSILFEHKIKNDHVLEVSESSARLFRVFYSGEKSLVAEAQSFLHLLFYLAYQYNQNIQQLKSAIIAKAKEDRAKKIAQAKEEKIKAKEAKAKAKQLSTGQPNLFDFAIGLEKQEKEAAPESGKKPVGFELEERDGVTFIKNTNFVLSKFL